MNEYIKILCIVCPLVFTAGFVDAIAGGGGIISIPAYLFAGLPAHIAAGTNKFAMSIGTAMSTWNYFKAGKINFSVAIYSIIGALIGATAGSNLAVFISEAALKTVLLVALPVAAIVIVTRKSFKEEPEKPKEMSAFKFRLLSFLIGFSIGMYDGLAGPGTGTFMILAFTGILGLDLVTASGCSKSANLASNVASVVVYITSGKVMFLVGVPAAICALLGGYTGSKLAIKGGTKYIRSIIFLVIILLFAKSAYDLYSFYVA